MIPTGKDLWKKPHFVSLYQILKFGAFIYLIDRTAEVIRYVLVLEVEYLGIVMKPELPTDYGYSGVCCQV